MNIAGALGDVLGSVTGTPKKAYLIIYPEESSSAGGGGILGAAASALGGAIGGLAGLGPDKLQVQYNPSSISIHASAQSTSFPPLQKRRRQNRVTQLIRPPEIVMSVDLIFDDVNIKDSFMLEKFQMATPSDVVSAVAGVVRALGKGYTVQPQTNGLLATALRPQTRCVSFQWADFSFTGEVASLSAEYTMFSVSGKPVRSKVHLEIIDSLSDKTAVKKWNKAFDDATKLDILDIITDKLLN